MAELAPSGGGPNRLFVILALGLGGLLVLGLLGVGGFFLIQRFTTPAPAAPTAIRIAATTPTRALPTATLQPTDVPSPTFVLVAQSAATITPGGVSAAATVTTTVGAGTGTPTSSLPNTGVGEDLLLLAGGVVLVLIVFAARRARASGSA